MPYPLPPRREDPMKLYQDRIKLKKWQVKNLAYVGAKNLSERQFTVEANVKYYNFYLQS